MENEEKMFGLAVDLLGAAMKGLALYTVLLTTNFWLYQEGGGAFQPVLLGLIVPFMMLLAYIYCRFDDGICFDLHMAAGLVGGITAYYLFSNTFYVIMAIVIAIADSLFQKFVLGDMDSRRYAKRYKMQYYTKWGVIMAIVSIVMSVYSNQPNEGAPISPQVCNYYMIGAFAVYLLLIVLLKYMFLQYNYFRQKESIGNHSYAQMKRMNLIIGVSCALFIGLAVLMLNETIVNLATKMILAVLGGLAGLGIFGLSKIELSKLENGSAVVDGVTTGEMPVIEARPTSEFPVEGVCMVILIAAVIYSLWKLYKSFAANYKTGSDEAEYIRMEEDKKIRFSTVYSKKQESHFSNNNRGKIRKMYYKDMSARIKQSKCTDIKGKTPRELAESYSIPKNRKQIHEMTDIYRKARYSNEECMSETVNRMRELVKNKMEEDNNLWN